MTGTITVTHRTASAIAVLKDYPNSRYMKPALDKTLELSEARKFTRVFSLGYTPRDGDIIQYQKTGELRYFLGGLWRYATAVPSGVLVEIWEPVLIHSAPPETFTFEIPIEEARKIGGCTVKSLVEEYDRLHPKKSEFRLALEGMTGGQAIRGSLRHGGVTDLYIKNGKGNFDQYGNSSGTNRGEWTIGQLEDHMRFSNYSWTIV